MATVSSKPIRQFSDKGEEMCSLCCNEANAWSVGSCDHYVCLTCSVRLRVLCDKKECPVCRDKNDKVIVFRKPQPYSIPRQCIEDKKHGIMFHKSSLSNIYDNIIAVRCKVCDKRGMHSMRQLSEHLRREHGLHMCDICVEHLKLFPHEHKLYTRPELVRHRREGDPDDKSHKGHPQCEFCDERYFGKDELFYHLKENHFWCHFCENFGNQEYYPSYELLKGHFQKAHFLCEEGPCRHEKYTNVFLSKLDMQAHKAKVHTKGLSKSEAKQLRHVDVGFTYTRKERGAMEESVHRRSHRTGQHGGGGTLEKDIELAITASLSSQVNNTREDPGQETANQHTNNSTSLKGGGGASGTDSSKLVNKVGGVSESRKKPPPGLEHVVPPLSNHIDVEDDEDTKRDDWPSLGIEQPLNKTIHLHYPRPSTETGGGPPAPPPGFHLPPTSSSSSSLTGTNTEYNILQDAIKILKNDQEKVNNFKVVSGQFQKGDMSATDYNNTCVRLFGSDWIDFGIRLAATVPNPDKRHELLTKLISTSTSAQGGVSTVPATKPPPGFTSSNNGKTIPVSSSNGAVKENNSISNNKKASKKRNRNGGNHGSKGAWQSSRHFDSSGVLQESEFPTLKTASSELMSSATNRGGMGVRPSWNMKVAATVK